MPESRRLLTADRYNGFTAYDLRKPGRELQILQCSLPTCLPACRHDISMFRVSKRLGISESRVHCEAASVSSVLLPQELCSLTAAGQLLFPFDHCLTSTNTQRHSCQLCSL
jgi:hypothetical protein